MTIRAAEVDPVLDYLSKQEREALADLLDRDQRLFKAQPGPQIEALESQADILGFGGAGGGGKSYLVCGLALQYHQRSLILRREKNQTEKFVQDFTTMIGNDEGYNSQKSQWRYDGRLIEFGGLDDPSAHRKWQGRDHDLKAIDEATECREAQVRFVLGWTRTADATQRARAVLTFNPPTTAEGRWIIPFFGPWIDRKAAMRADPGELLWMATLGDRPDVIVPDHRPFVLHGNERIYDFDPDEYRGAKQTLIIKPKSRTFIPSKVTDNQYYMATDYISTLQALPEPLRSQMLNGDFQAGVEDDANQLIPTAWIEAAMARWKPRDDKGIMDSMGVDVSRGSMGGTTGGMGKDRTVIARRHGTWFDDLIALKGIDVTDGPAVASQVLAKRRDNAVVHLDIVGVGTSPFDFLQTNHVQTVGVNGAAKSFDHDKSGQLSFVNLRSELYWKMREALDPSNPHPIYLPDDAELMADLAAPRWWLSPAGIVVEPKHSRPGSDGKVGGLAARLGRSPDRGDAVVYALLATPKRNVVFGGFAGLPQPAYDRFAELSSEQNR